MLKFVFWRVPIEEEIIGMIVSVWAVAYLVERCRVFHEWVGVLWTEKLAWQMDVLNGLEGFGLKRLSQKLRGEEQEASLTVINIIIHKTLFTSPTLQN